MVPLHNLDLDKYKFQGVCQFHQNKCIEGLCSNHAITNRLGLGGIDEVPNLSDDHEIWDIIGYYLGTMCSNLTLTLSLEKIIIGGGIMNRGEVLF
jgi:fructokinase